MRYRFKPWALPQLKASPYVCTKPEEYKGRWQKFFKDENKDLSLELGSGNGRFILNIAQARPKYNYLGIDIEPLVLAHTDTKLKELGLDNCRLLYLNINKIKDYFSKDEVSELFINFPNPWPKRRQNKRRLTHPRKLIQYRGFLKDNALVYFKTDSLDLYKDSLKYFEEMGFEILKHSDQLLTEDMNDEKAIMTEYEERWRKAGKDIKAIVARKVKADEEQLKLKAKNYIDT